MNQHEGKPETETTFKCSYCNRTLKTKETLQAHENQHLGYRPDVCRYCDKSYTLVKNLKYHVRKHHTDEVGFEEYLKTFKSRERYEYK